MKYFKVDDPFENYEKPPLWYKVGGLSMVGIAAAAAVYLAATGRLTLDQAEGLFYAVVIPLSGVTLIVRLVRPKKKPPSDD